MRKQAAINPVITNITSTPVSLPTYHEFRSALRSIHGLIYNPLPQYDQADKKIGSLSSRFNLNNDYYFNLLYRYVYVYEFGTAPTDKEQIYVGYNEPVFRSIRNLYDYLLFLSAQNDT